MNYSIKNFGAVYNYVISLRAFYRDVFRHGDIKCSICRLNTVAEKTVRKVGKFCQGRVAHHRNEGDLMGGG